MSISNNGNHNFGFSARDIQHSNVHLGAGGPAWVQPLEIHRSWNVPLPIKPTWMGIAGGLSMAGSIASLWSVSGIEVPYWPDAFQHIGLWALPLGICGMLVLTLASLLGRRRFVNFGPFALELGDDDQLRLTRLEGKCPMCTGHLLMSAGPKHDPGCHLTCSRNSKHTWLFDYTSLAPADREEEAAAR